jgi:2-aminoadipate transaminase
MAENLNTSDEIEHLDWNPFLAKRMENLKSSAIRELLKLTVQPNIISFAGGLPAPEFFPVREFGDACASVLDQNGQDALQYSTTEGFAPLKNYLAVCMSKYGIEVEIENMLMVSGSQQGLDLIGKVLIDPQEAVLTSRPTYLGALQAWNAYQAHFVTVPLDDDGMCVDEIPALLDQNPATRLIYVLPNFHNPAGTTLPLERRKRLVEIARQRDLIIIEDDPYGELRFEGQSICPLFSLAPERTIYLSTFSKTLAPGIRLAWVVAPKPVISRLVQAKQGADLHTGTFVQMVAHEICQSGFLRKHVHHLVDVYRQRRDVMLDALEEHMPRDTAWTRPKGGLFLWVRTPKTINTRELLETAIDRKVAYVPGYAFYPGEIGGLHAMRLNFSNADAEKIAEGISRIGIAMKEILAVV